MAQDLDDGEFWLPSSFLTEEDIFTDFSTTGFNSPVESVTETESDEDEFFAELTRRISRSSLLHDPKEGLGLSRSPQSTLFPVGSSSRGSPTGPVSPPPATEGYLKGNDTSSFDLLNAAAGEVAKLRMKTEQQQLRGIGTGYFDSSRGFQQTPHVPLRPAFHGFYPHRQFPPQNIFHNRPLGLPPTAWPPLQRSPAQTLSIPKRESVGTGVFLPRRVEVNPNPNPIDSRRIKTRIDRRGQGSGFHGQRRNSTEIRLPSEWTY